MTADCYFDGNYFESSYFLVCDETQPAVGGGLFSRLLPIRPGASVWRKDDADLLDILPAVVEVMNYGR